jgi:hypothetical protein
MGSSSGRGTDDQVPNEELVHAYISGKISKRALVRGLIAGGLSVTGANNCADAMAARSVEAAPPEPPGQQPAPHPRQLRKRRAKPKPDPTWRSRASPLRRPGV